jgi:hypothetical protein
MKKLINTKETAILITTLEEGIRLNTWKKEDCIAKYIKFNCLKCGKEEIKRDVSLINSKKLICGPCLRKEGTFKLHGSETWNNQEKTKQTNLEKYGVENTFQLPKVIEMTKNRDWSERNKKLVNTNLRKYGVKNPGELKEVKEKMQKTSLKKYDVKHPVQNSDIQRKCSSKKYLYKDLYFDSSWELAFWIWHEDNNIKIKRNNQKFKLDNNYYCFPDFIVNNQIIEIKGDHLKNYPGWELKEKCYKENNIKVLFTEDISFYIKYIKNNYEKNYLNQFKIITWEDEIKNVIAHKKNNNVIYIYGATMSGKSHALKNCNRPNGYDIATGIIFSANLTKLKENYSKIITIFFDVTDEDYKTRIILRKGEENLNYIDYKIRKKNSQKKRNASKCDYIVSNEIELNNILQQL